MESGCAMQLPAPENLVSTNFKESFMESQTQQDCVSPEHQAGSSESPEIRDMKLPKCFVLLHRLTDKDINRLYPSDSDEISDDVWSKTEELIQKTEESVNEDGYLTHRKHGTKRPLRSNRRSKPEKFELYKKRRQNFINRRNRVSHSDNSLDWSPDEFGEKTKKKLKRGRKYELDYEWCPSKPKNAVQSPRNLRRHVRRPVIDSDTSSSSEEDVLFNIYMEEFNSDLSSDRSVSVNSVPSSFTYEHVDKCGLTFSGKNLSMKNQKPSQVSNTKTSLPNSDSLSGDLISGIIKDMNELKGTNIPASTKSSAVNFKPVQRGRKRLKMNFTSPNSKNNTEKEVSTLLQHMIRTVTNQVKQLDGTKKKFSKVCKWCSTPFATNSEKEVMCAICWDLGKGKFSRGNPNIKRSPNKTLNVRCSKENKVTKKRSNAMSQVLKKLPKSDMQRLMYAEKTDKMPFEKGYNHCKSFATPKDIRENSFSKNNSNLNSSAATKSLKSINSINSKSNPDLIGKNVNSNSAVSQNNRIPVKKKLNVQDKTIRQCIEFAKSFASSSKRNSSPSTQPVPAKIPTNKYEQFRNNKVILQSLKGGMFQIKFPDSDKKCESQASSQNNNGAVTINNSFSSSNTASKLHDSDKHDTYLFPPIPTVIVSNYCKDTNGLNLSHTYFQNELTHKHALKSSTPSLMNKSKTETAKTIPEEKQMVSVLKSGTYSNACLTTSNILPNNSSLTFTTIPVNQILPLSTNTSTVYTTLIPSTPKSVTLMPVVSSIVSLSNSNLSIAPVEKNSVNMNMDRFINNNYVNSQDLGIKITHVTTEKSSNQKNNNQNAASQNMPEGPRITHVIAEYKQKDNPQTVDTSAKQNSNSTSNVDKSDLNADKSAKLSLNNALQQSGRPTDTTENATKSAMDVIGAVSILAVIDLEKNPLTGLNYRIHVTKEQLAKLTSEKNITPELNDKIASCQNNLQLLNIAKKYLSFHGSFTKVSDFFLRKTQIQIKKEIFEESTQSSCMYSNPSPSNNSSINNSTDDSRMSETSAPPVTNNVQNFNSCQLNDQMSINHIQKLQSQIAAMNNAQKQHYDALAYTVHHYPVDQQFAALTPAVAAPTPVTPRNDCMGVEARETPSRGSGPRTPARPESAASQSEEPSLIQIKKEQMEASSSPPSQCAYSQNTTTTTPVPQVPSQITVMPEIPALNMSDPSISNALHQIPVSNANQLYPNQPNVHQQVVAPNRAISYSNNDTYSLLNITSKQQVNPVVSNPDMRQNRQILMGQQMYIQNNIRQSVPSVNNQLVIRPPYVSANNGGTLIVNNSPVGQNALLTNVSNQQFYTNQVSQLYYPPSTQISCVPTNPSVATITPIQNQQAEIPADQMVCAVCQNQATLRCKQCARVAYCNTTCAKTYWHQKHKMECKPLPS